MPSTRLDVGDKMEKTQLRSTRSSQSSSRGLISFEIELPPIWANYWRPQAGTCSVTTSRNIKLWEQTQYWYVKSPGVSKTVSNLLCDIQQATSDQLMYKTERLGHISEFTTWSIIQIPYSLIFIVSPSTWVNGLGNEWMALADVVRFGTTQREEG